MLPLKYIGTPGKYSIRFKPYVSKTGKDELVLSICIFSNTGGEPSRQAVHLPLDNLLEVQEYIDKVITLIKQNRLDKLLKGSKS